MIFKREIFIIFLVIVLIFVSFYSLMSGSYGISLEKIYSVMANKLFGTEDSAISKMDIIVFYDIRLPRIITAFLVGLALSCAGAVYQSCFRNPLVEPFILGASSGAAFGAAIGIVFGTTFLGVSTTSFLFSLLAVGIAYFLAKGDQGVPVVGLILSGVIVSSIFSAFVSILKYTSEDTQLREITFWMMGGLYYSNWTDVKLNFPIIILGFFVVWILSWKLNLLSMGDNEAKSLGIHPERYKLIFIVIATLMTSLCVSSVGIIAWIGLMMPHAVRLIVGPDNRWVIPACALLGAIYLILCDTIARNLTLSEIPVGIITSILGAPFLLWLLRYKRKELLK